MGRLHPVGTVESLSDVERQLVAALAVNGRATWGQLGRVLGVSETTAARRTQRLFDAGVLQIAGVPDPLACGFGQPVLVHIRCAPGTVRQVGQALADRDDARFVVLLAGRADVLVEMVATDRDHLTRTLIDEIHGIEGVTDTSAETVLRTFKTGFDWSRELLGESAEWLRPPDIEPVDHPVALDEIDLALIAELGPDGRRSYADLASRLGVNDSLVARRVPSLISRGCLSFAPIVDPALLGYTMEAVIRLRVDLPRMEEAAALLCAQPAARYISATTGDSDLVCEVVLHDAEDLYAFTTRTLADIPGLRQVETAIELRTLKRAFLRRGPSGAVYRRYT